MTSVPGNPQPQPRKSATRRSAEDFANEVVGMRAVPDSGPPWVTRLKGPHPARIARAVGAMATVGPASVSQRYMIAYLLDDAGLLAVAEETRRTYTPCRYVLFEGEGGGCIANATTDDGYCKPHADALHELEREAADA